MGNQVRHNAKNSVIANAVNIAAAAWTRDTLPATNGALQENWRWPATIEGIAGYPETGNTTWRKDSGRIFINEVVR